MSVTGRPPGFYDDPDDSSGSARYWDGDQWTNHYLASRPAAEHPPGPLVPPPGNSRPGNRAEPTSVNGTGYAASDRSRTGTDRLAVASGFGKILFGVAFAAVLAMMTGGNGTGVADASLATGSVTAVMPAPKSQAGPLTCQVEYLFDVNGSLFTGRTVLPETQLCLTYPGDPITVQFDTADPRQSSPAGIPSEGGFPEWFRLLILTIPAWFVLLGIWDVFLRGTTLGERVGLIATVRKRASIKDATRWDRFQRIMSR